MTKKELMEQLQNVRDEDHIEIAFNHEDRGYDWYDVKEVDDCFSHARPDNEYVPVFLVVGQQTGSG